MTLKIPPEPIQPVYLFNNEYDSTKPVSHELSLKIMFPTFHKQNYYSYDEVNLKFPVE